MQELQLSPISPKFVPPQQQEMQIQQLNGTLDMPSMTEKPEQNPEKSAHVQAFSPPDDLTI